MQGSATGSRTNFQVKRLEPCDNTDYPIKLKANITHENGKQYLNSDMFTPFPWDHNIGASHKKVLTKAISPNFKIDETFRLHV